MKTLFTLLLAFTMIAQHVAAQSRLTDGELIRYEAATNDAQHPCISEQEYRTLETEIAHNQQVIGLSKKSLYKAGTTLLSWPLKPSDKLHDCSYYRIAAYVDHNSAATAISDFDCGTNTYDGHKGTDIATWPFNFYKMDSNLVEVIAAHSGTIIAKHDGEFDRNCSSNTLTANYVIIQHDDGSEALYWHMKSGSITTKAVGATINVGEHVGIVGSSGSASGPHLHFEVWNGSTNAALIDPYSGACNNMNTASWWSNQKTHSETQVIKASVNTTDIVLPPCPATETLNESSVYPIPFQGPGLNPGYAKFYIFIRDEMSGQTATMSILNPDGSTNLSWTYSSTTTVGSKIMGYSKKLPLTPGEYTFQAVYNGITCSTKFTTVAATSLSNLEGYNAVNIYPNPSHGTVEIEFSEAIFQTFTFNVTNTLGEVVFVSPLHAIKNTLTTKLKTGIYFYVIEGENGMMRKGKLVID